MPVAPPPLPCACATLRRTARSVTQLYDDALRASGLRVTQFTLLQVLERRGESTQGQLSEMLAMDSTTLSRTLKLMEDKGWIESIPGEDRRERHLRPTREGRRRLARAEPLWNGVQGRLEASLGKANWVQLLAALDGAVKAAQRV